MTITRPSRLGPTPILLGALALGCHRAPPPGGPPDPGAGPVTVQVLRPDQLYVLEVTGVPPSDTVLTIRGGAARTVIIRHGPPDNNVFAEVELPATALETPDSVHIEILPRPGVYGVEIRSDHPFGRGARLRFKYPVHFSAPVGAQERYGSPVLFERVLAIAQLREDGRYALLVSTRPAADNLEAPLAGPGTYLVAAPR